MPNVPTRCIARVAVVMQRAEIGGCTLQRIGERGKKIIQSRETGKPFRVARKAEAMVQLHDTATWVQSRARCRVDSLILIDTVRR